MPNKDDVLCGKTYKEDGLELEKRVFHTLSDVKSLQHHRNAKAIALLVKLLHEKGHLSDQEIDGLLLECVR